MNLGHVPVVQCLCSYLENCSQKNTTKDLSSSHSGTTVETNSLMFLFLIFLKSGFIKMLRAELEKNLRRFAGHFSNVRLPAVHANSDRLPVHVPQASSDPALQLILRFGLPATPVYFCLQESPKVLNWASLGDNGGFDSGVARTVSQAHFPQPGSLPLLLSWSSIRGLLVLHTSFLQYMMHIRLADVELPGQRVPWCTNTVARLFHQPVLACFGVVFSGFWTLPLFLSSFSPLPNLSKI